MLQQQSFKMHHTHIVFYDGDCAFCLKSVQLIFKNNPSKNIFFCSLQSETAKAILDPFETSPLSENVDTLIYLDNGKIYKYADAVFHVCKQLRYPYKMLSIFSFLPFILKKYAYILFAKNRHKFSKNSRCEVPSNDFKRQILPRV